MPKFSLKEHFIYLFAFFITASTFAFDLMLSFHEIPQSNKDIVNMIAGVLNTSCLVVVVAYFYSSTASSKEKNKALLELQNQGKEQTQSKNG